MPGRFKLWAAAMLTILALAAAGCSKGAQDGLMQPGEAGSGRGSQNGGMEGMNMGKTAREYKPPTAEQLAKVTRTVEISLNDQFKIEPKDIKIKKGDVVKFVVKNVGQLPHDWMVEGIEGVATGEFPGGQERVIVWAADRTGTFTTYCMVKGHKEAGMTGTLTVSE